MLDVARGTIDVRSEQREQEETCVAHCNEHSNSSVFAKNELLLALLLDYTGA